MLSDELPSELNSYDTMGAGEITVQWNGGSVNNPVVVGGHRTQCHGGGQVGRAGWRQRST